MLTNVNSFFNNSASLNKIVPVIVFTLLIFSCFASLLTIFFGTDSYSMLHVFSHDESDQVQRLQRLLEKDTLNTGGFKGGFYSYGQFYSSIAFWSIKIISIFGFGLTDFQVAALTLKIISIIAYFFSIFFMYKVINLIVMNQSISAAFAFIFAVFPNYWHWSSSIHPDMVQMLTLILPIYALIRIKRRYLSIIVASFLIGLSFGTKYSGLFIVILIAVYVLISIIQRHIIFKKNNNIMVFFILSSWSAISFLLGWLLFNPYVLVHFNKFFEELSIQTGYLKYGLGTYIDPSGFKWFTIFYHQLGLFNSVIVAGGVIIAFFFLVRQIIKAINNKDYLDVLDNKIFSIMTSVSIYVIVASIYLLLVVKYREVRYGFHILPYLVILSAYGFNYVFEYLKLNKIIIFLFSLLVVSLTYPTYSSNLVDLSSQYRSKLSNVYLDAGEWMENNYSQDMAVLAGTYSYLPDDYFNRYSMTYDLNKKSIDDFYPDIVVMNNSVPGRYVWKKPGTKFADLELDIFPWKDQFMLDEYVNFFKEMVSNDSDWIISYETHEIVIFEKR